MPGLPSPAPRDPRPGGFVPGGSCPVPPGRAARLAVPFTPGFHPEPAAGPGARKPLRGAGPGLQPGVAAAWPRRGAAPCRGLHLAAAPRLRGGGRGPASAGWGWGPGTGGQGLGAGRGAAPAAAAEGGGGIPAGGKREERRGWGWGHLCSLICVWGWCPLLLQSEAFFILFFLS